MTHPGRTRSGSTALQTTAVCALLLLATSLVFGRVVHHDFINYDDREYVYENPRVSAGLTAGGIEWAFTQRYASNWHPLTWLSHMLDSQIYGLNPGGHHLSSVMLHAGAAILLFLVLQQMTGLRWTSAFAASLFAVHPLRVESVAWVAERKDVLSGLFFMLTLGAYLWYVRKPRSFPRFLLVALAYALGLMSKPMLVTLPAVLLLLDYWPLGRALRHSFVTLAREKIPLAALAAVSCAVTLWAQRAAMMPGGQLPLSWRLGNAVVASAAYVGKFFYPADLAVFYPHPGSTLPAWVIAAAAFGLTGMTAGVVALRRRQPHLLVGWLWYVGMLVPVVGLVQVGEQAMADRYTYLPQVGLGVAAAWSLAAARRTGIPRGWLYGAAGATILLLAGVAWRQTGYWRNGETLFAHALASTSRNYIAHNSLGVILAARGRQDEAIAHYRKALEIKPDYAIARYNLGNALANRGQIDEAIAQYQKALEIRPDYAEAHINLGNTLADLRRPDEAIAHFRKALEIDPGLALARNNLGNSLFVRGQIDEAIAQYRKALEIKPDFAEARLNLGGALAERGQADEAILQYREALNLAVLQRKQALAELLRSRLASYEAIGPTPR